MPTPPDYGLGADRHYYFSHMLNCLYDCRYCFLQGMYQSANYVLFVNFEDFQSDIRSIAEANPDQQHFFFSGYDCDSLAPVTWLWMSRSDCLIWLLPSPASSSISGLAIMDVVISTRSPERMRRTGGVAAS